ncbi:MAG: Transcriptional regulator, AsnC family [Candidatus Fermentimicrarchaeum limneticum]|uniref:Transcriptional regulator, AsnC family n=1 Tax=Fermentimicrarchaeum limneticum TaxID=2795018 RepID=A0A7D5XET9_FERL1|nr:MAG: Transcriptional regulator, AsnC family [Candidatus Fermentimicrarchaeum limneticum]
MNFFGIITQNLQKEVVALEKIRANEEDLLLLEMLQTDCRKSLKEIAKKAGMPMSTVHEKIKRFEKTGLIKSYRALLDEKKLGFDVTAFIMASTEYLGGDKNFQRKLGEKVASLPNVLGVHTVSGDWDLIIKVKFKGVQQLGKFVNESVRTIPGIDKTMTMVSIDEIKEDTILTLG